MSANANGWHGVPIKAPILKNSEAKTGRLSGTREPAVYGGHMLADGVEAHR